MHRSAAEVILMARRPMVRTDLRTNSTSTSEAYLWVVRLSAPLLPYVFKIEEQEEKGKENALFQLRQHLLHVLLRHQPINDLQLCEFDVNRVVVLAEEHLDFVLQHGRSTLDDEVDVAEGDVLDFVAGGEEGDCGSE